MLSCVMLCLSLVLSDFSILSLAMSAWGEGGEPKTRKCKRIGEVVFARFT